MHTSAVVLIKTFFRPSSGRVMIPLQTLIIRTIGVAVVVMTIGFVCATSVWSMGMAIILRCSAFF